MFIIKDVEKIKKGTSLFRSFSLQIKPGEVVALYSESEIRSAIMSMLISPKKIQKGNITMNEICHDTQYHQFIKHTCLHSYTDGLYERLTVLDHLLFYKRLYGSPVSLEHVLDQMMLHRQKKQKISQLTYSEQRRIHFSHVLLRDVPLYVLEEPDLHIDIETKRMYHQLLETLQKEQKQVLILTSNLQHAISASDLVFELSENGCKKIQLQSEEQNEPNKKESIPFQFDKIPTKVDDKILLFDPYHIDYIESVEGQASLFVHGESFPTTFTLQQLEKRLQPFGFFRCHRSYIVNLQKVKEVITWTRNSFNLILDDSHATSIPLSKSKMSELKEMIGLI